MNYCGLDIAGVFSYVFVTDAQGRKLAAGPVATTRVTVVNPNKVKAIAESRRETDKIDAKILCELLRLQGLPEPVHMPGRETRALRGLLVARRQLVAARTKIGNVVRGLLRQEGVRLASHALTSLVGWQRLLEDGFERPRLTGPA